MEKQAELEIRRAQVIRYLWYCTLMQISSGFCLDDQHPVNDHVETLAGDLLALVKNGN